MAEPGLRVALLSLEPWDDVWRRNQHLAAELVALGEVSALQWISPPSGGLRPRATSTWPLPGIEVVVPPLVVPRRYGGHRVLGRWLRRQVAEVDVVWVNDPVAGRAAVPPGRPAMYDVTDDWRSMPQPTASRRRIVAAEDELASRVPTVVCSAVLADRWRCRYGVEAALVPNAVDVAALRSARPRRLDGPAPHVVYVGTVHTNRVDLELIAEVAASGATVHLVGPEHLAPAEQQRLTAAGVRVIGPVPAADVPSWLVSADVLVCPHVVDEFTLSLDAIKAHEYLATDRPVVATPSCGFQSLTADGLTVVDRSRFAAAVAEAAGTGPFPRPAPASWADRATEFARTLRAVAGAGAVR
jgi:teichuronic acid biosynthesis glycosyltransferase TuaH